MACVVRRRCLAIPTRSFGVRQTQTDRVNKGFASWSQVGFFCVLWLAALLSVSVDDALTSIVSRKPVMMNHTHAAHPTHAGRQADTRSASELGGHTQHTLHTLHTNPIGSLFVLLGYQKPATQRYTRCTRYTDRSAASCLTLNFDSPMSLPRFARVVEGHHSRQKPPAAP